MSAILEPGASADSPLDHGLVTFFPAPHSFTGEDVVEFAVHGSTYIVGRMLDGLARIGVRPARAGEFSERAFLNGKLDLSQAEAIADLVLAETEVQARVAREQLEGRLSTALDEVGEPLRALVAEIEAHIDFPEEGIEPLAVQAWDGVLESIERRLSAFIDTFSFGRVCREGALVVLAGAPNAGKSSLLNRLLGEERAIVTPIPGTTRDTIEEVASFAGLPVRLCDTAGLVDDESSGGRSLDVVERIGIQRSHERLLAADVALFVQDLLAPLDLRLLELVRSRARRVIIVANKVDLLPAAEVDARLAEHARAAGAKVLGISARDGVGLDALRENVRDDLLPPGALEGAGSLLVTSRRHHDALRLARDAILRARAALASHHPSELVAADLRDALGALTEIVGVTSTEDILGLIFSKFCIGK